MDFELEELSTGIHRLETIAGDRRHAYHLIEKESGLAIVDTGFAGAIEGLFEPALDELGYQLTDVSTALITHADADHHGGNAELRERIDQVTIAAHKRDVPLIETTDNLINDRYRQFEDEHNIGYGSDLLDDLRGMVSGDTPVDYQLNGGEILQSDPGPLRILHTPGHTAGHVMLYHTESGLVIGGDGFFGRGITDVNGKMTQPAPYHLYSGYVGTLQLIDALDVSTLSFTHYPVLEGQEIAEFIQDSYDFVDEIDALLDTIIDQRDSITIEDAIEYAVDQLGSFGLDLDLAYPFSAHLEQRCQDGEVVRVDDSSPVEYRKP